MKLNDFPFNSGNGMEYFSNLMLKAFNAVSMSLKCTFHPDTSNQYNLTGLVPHVSFFNWEPYNRFLCYGQFMEYDDQNKKVKFWAGLDIKPDKVRFILWVDKAKLHKSSSNSPLLNVVAGSPLPNSNRNENVETGGNALWIALEDTEFQKFCNDPHNTSQVLESFIQTVCQTF